VIDHRGDLVILELLGEGRHREGYTTSAMAFPCRPQSAARSLRIRIVLVTARRDSQPRQHGAYGAVRAVFRNLVDQKALVHLLQKGGC